MADTATATLPADGGPTRPTGGAGILVGTDGNAFSIMGTTARALKEAGATPAYIAAYRAAAMGSDYDNLLAVSMAALDSAPDGAGADLD